MAENNFGATATVPVELLQRYYGATYTTPQTSIHPVGYVNLTGKVEATPIWTIEGSAHVRVFDRERRRLMPTDWNSAMRRRSDVPLLWRR